MLRSKDLLTLTSIYQWEREVLFPFKKGCYMSKNEFLSVLRGRITGQIPTREVESQIDYYAAYIDGRIGAGLTEEEAVEELGDPRLIAKTVIAAVDRAAEEAGYDGPYRSSTDTYDDSDGINSGIFGKSGPSPYGTAGGARKEHSGYQEHDYRQAERTASQPEPERSKQKGGKTFSAGSLGCIIAVLIFVLIMVLFWVLTMFVFRLGFTILGWLFPVIAVVAVIALIFSRRRNR